MLSDLSGPRSSDVHKDELGRSQCIQFIRRERLRERHDQEISRGSMHFLWADSWRNPVGRHHVLFDFTSNRLFVHASRVRWAAPYMMIARAKL